MVQPTVLIVDDDPSILRFFSRVLSQKMEVITATNGKEARTAVRTTLVDAILLDQKLPDTTGLNLLREFREELPEVPIVIITGHGDVQTAVEAMKLGAQDFILKPVGRDLLLEVMDRVLEVRRLRVRLKELEKEELNRILDDFVVESLAMQNILHTVLRIAPTPATVLILGETGVGKDRIAQLIHHLSGRKGPFVALNCAAIPSDLIESELFGYEKGAFTGATRANPGKIRMADQGTLFLDEVGEMPLHLQSKLLRVLETRKVLPLGGREEIDVNFRLITATNQNLETKVREGKFREDLYFRIHVVQLTIPPLRDRPEDIVPLLHHFFKKAVKHYQREDLRGFHPDLLEILKKHSWPGNVRELQHLVERLVLLAQGPLITPEDLPE
ncbi:MAG: sigma-54 dependent transcriptional regulator, partial [Candidatus Hydrothermae bacterium]|nr:sigma-54 dependent transcriptional regulator [Candidatus Hydrothermae bacterium]